MQDVERLLLELLKMKSPTGKEAEISDFVYRFLKKEGFGVSKDEVGEGRFNVIAETGRPRLFLSAHIDTVAGDLPIKKTETAIFGRGACDTKGSLAAMIMAVIESKKEGLSNFGQICTIGEETDFCGVKKVVSSGIKIPFVIVGEPTSLDIVNGHYGILETKLLAKGKKAHSSQPELGVNAVDKIVDAVNLFRKIRIHPNSSVSLCQLHGGSASNIIPDSAEATITFRISPGDKIDYFKKMQKLADENIEVLVVQRLGSIYAAVPEPLKFIKNVRTVKYSTELSFYKKGVVLGPGDIAYAHSDNEKIGKEELIKAVEVYKKAISGFCLN